MADGVRTALIDIHRTHSNASEEEAQLWLKQLEADGRYLVDVWASD